MSLNSSAFSGDYLSSIKLALPFGMDCFIANPGYSVFISYTITLLSLLFPLCIFVLYRGLQRWWKQRSSITAVTTSHSDSFAYHMVTMELMNVFGSILYCCCINQNILPVLLLWFFLSAFTCYGEMFFHVLTCVEHYFAVVHPIIYLSLRKGRGILIRNIIIGCIWLFSIVGTLLMSVRNLYLIVELCILISCLIVVCFCCLSVLLVLIRPSPGKQGKDRVRVDQSKQKAFYTIVATLGVLLLKFSWNLVWTVISMLNGHNNSCAGVLCALWMNLPGSLLLPLLFLQRAVNLVSCKSNIK